MTDRIFLDQLSWATPARWGFAASASTIDAHRLIPGPTDPKDQHWDHKASAWLFDMAMLGVLCVAYSAIVWWRIRLKRHWALTPDESTRSTRADGSRSPIRGQLAPGRDVVVGSDVRADLRVAHPLIARAHLLLRFDRGRWMAIDNNSLNGMFVGGQRMPMVDIHDGQTINIGKPEGPQVTFAVGHHTGTVGHCRRRRRCRRWDAAVRSRPDRSPAPPRPLRPPRASATPRHHSGAAIKTRCRTCERTTAVPRSANGHSGRTPGGTERP